MLVLRRFIAERWRPIAFLADAHWEAGR